MPSSRASPAIRPSVHDRLICVIVMCVCPFHDICGRLFAVFACLDASHALPTSQPFTNWRAASALTLIDNYPTRAVVICSWTKLWSCPGLRLGIIAASPAWTTTLKKMQTPWSCNSAAQAFAVAAAGDGDYLRRTWESQPGWKRQTEERLVALGWKPNGASPPWVPWVYVDTGSEATARRASDVAQAAGVPVRWCKSYGQPAFLRLGVRCPASQDVLFSAWAQELGKAG